MEKKDTKEELNFERIFSQIDNACSALLCLKKNYLIIGGRKMVVISPKVEAKILKANLTASA